MYLYAGSVVYIVCIYTCTRVESHKLGCKAFSYFKNYHWLNYPLNSTLPGNILLLKSIGVPTYPLLGWSSKARQRAVIPPPPPHTDSIPPSLCSYTQTSITNVHHVLIIILVTCVVYVAHAYLSLCGSSRL